jgi:hypothetical protein
MRHVCFGSNTPAQLDVTFKQVLPCLSKAMWLLLLYLVHLQGEPARQQSFGAAAEEQDRHPTVA